MKDPNEPVLIGLALVLLMIFPAGAVIFSAGGSGIREIVPVLSSDVGPLDITTDRGALMYNTSLTNITFRVTVANFGSSDISTAFWANITVTEKGKTTILFSDDSKLTSLLSNSSTDVIFTKWTHSFSTPLNYTLTVRTNLSGDQNTGNDSTSANLQIVDLNDIALGESIMPVSGALLHTSTGTDLAVSVDNRGTFFSTATINVHCRIFEHGSGKKIYDSNASVEDLDAQSSGEAAFSPTWTTPSAEGYYIINYTLSYADDQRIGNNATQITVWVNDLLDVAPTYIGLSPDRASYGMGENITINATVEVTGNVIPLVSTEVNCRILDQGNNVIYSHNVSLSGFSEARRTLWALFPEWTTPTLGNYRINISLDLFGDEIAGNDHTERVIVVEGINHNIGPSTITSTPTTPVKHTDSVVFDIPVINYGDVTENSVNVTLSITNRSGVEIYNRTTMISTGIGPTLVGHAIINSSNAWVPPIESGPCTVKAWTSLLFDSNPGNDMTTITISVINDPDVAVQEIMLNTTMSYRIGELSFNASILNSGDIPLSTSIEATIRDPEGTLTALDAAPVLSLEPGLITNVSFVCQLLVEGDHTISVMVNDSRDTDHSNDIATVVIHASAGRPPVVVISAPLNNSQYALGEPVQFSSEGTYDPDGGNLTYLWVSERDSTLSTAPAFITSSLSAAIHRITLTLTDEDGFSVSRTVFITVLATQVLYYRFQALNVTVHYTGLAPTVLANNMSLPPDPPVGLVSMALAYDLSVSGTLVSANVSIDYGMASPEILGSVDTYSVHLYRLSTSWTTITGSGNDPASQRAYARWATTPGSIQLAVFGQLLTGVNGTLSGHVLDADDMHPVQGADVKVFNTSTSTVPCMSTTTGPQGTYSFTLPVGDYFAEATAAGYATSTRYHFRAGTVVVPRNITLHALPTGTMSGTVLDSFTSEPLEGVNIELRTPVGDEIASTTTDTTGAYALSGIPVGAYRINLTLDGYISTETTLSVSAGDNSFDTRMVFINSPPVLSDPHVTPSSGDQDTEFTFSVTYTDTDGDAPQNNVVYLVIGSRRYELTSQGTDTRAGVLYTSAPLKVSPDHTSATFTASDRRGAGASPVNLPLDIHRSDSSSSDVSPMVYAGGVAGIVLLVVVVVALVLFVLKRKEKKGDEEIEELAEAESDVQEIMCTGCGTILNANVTLCPSCGRDLSVTRQEREAGFTCPSCGAFNDKGAVKCRGCGKDLTAKVKDTTHTPETAVAPAPAEIPAPVEGPAPAEIPAPVVGPAPAETPAPVEEPPGPIEDIDLESLSFEGLDE